MKNLTVFNLTVQYFLFAMFLGVGWPAAAQETTLNFCTGGKKGNYFAAGKIIKKQLQGGDIKNFNVVSTKGSMDNLKRMAKGECDGGIVQADAYFVYSANKSNAALELERAGHIYDEYVHLICNRDSSIDSVGDLEDNPEKYTIAVGKAGGGSAVTWKAFGLEDDDYAKVKTLPIGGSRAIQKVADGSEIQCLFYVSGLRSKLLARAERESKYLQLVDVDDSDFNDTVDPRGSKVYSFSEIDNGVYSELQGTFGDTDTVAVKAVVVVRIPWVEENEDAYDEFIDALAAARPHILERVGQ